MEGSTSTGNPGFVDLLCRIEHDMHLASHSIPIRLKPFIHTYKLAIYEFAHSDLRSSIYFYADHIWQRNEITFVNET